MTPLMDSMGIFIQDLIWINKKQLKTELLRAKTLLEKRIQMLYPPISLSNWAKVGNLVTFEFTYLEVVWSTIY